MKRKLIVLLAFSIIGLGNCSKPCLDPRPDKCGFDNGVPSGTWVKVNNQPRFIPNR